MRAESYSFVTLGRLRFPRPNLEATMPTSIEMTWRVLEQQNRNISAKLDKRFNRDTDPHGCHNYIRQRRGNPELTGRGRISYWYNGQRHQTAAYRLVYVRHHGRIMAGMDVNHMCHNGFCGNPDHLIAQSRSDHRKYDAERMRWEAEMKERFPNARGVYGAIPLGAIPDDA